MKNPKYYQWIGEYNPAFIYLVRIDGPGEYTYYRFDGRIEYDDYNSYGFSFSNKKDWRRIPDPEVPLIFSLPPPKP
jgi:hypothetical protein